MTIKESLLSAEEEIKPYLAIFKGCYERSIEQYHMLLNAYRKPFYNRTKAINFQNIIVNEIKEAFEEMGGVFIVEKYESISLVINNHISARFKKFNAKGLPSNHQSGRNDSIIAQQLTLGFLDYPPIAWIDVGYSLDATGTQYDFLKIICRRNQEIIWDLYFTDAGDMDNTAPTPIVNPTQPDIDIDTSRVTIKEDTEKNKKAK
jgi:hypothetical protein